MKKFIQSTIEQSDLKAIRYDSFIHYALYHPIKGYYQKVTSPFGKKGDFITSSFTNEVFSEVIADVMFDIVRQTDIPLTICELGGGDGRFARQLLLAFKRKGIQPNKYIFIEQNPFSRKQLLSDAANYCEIATFSSLQEFSKVHNSFSGIIFSNEFLDAQPVRVVVKENGTIQEVYITVNENGNLEEIYFPAPDFILKWMEKYSVQLSEGKRIEVPVYINDILESISELLNKGFMLTIDYGYTNEEWKLPIHKSGSLRGYYRHKMIHDITKHIGEMDITHHVHWDPWMSIAKQFGFDSSLLLKQHDFLMNVGDILQYLQSNKTGDYFSPIAKKNRAIQSLISGDMMGSMFEVCLQSKNIDKTLFETILKKTNFPSSSGNIE